MAGKNLDWLRRFLWVHRVLGWALCVLFVVWFASGIVMLFHGYPSYGEAERLADALPMDPGLELQSPQQLRRKGILLPEGTRLRRVGDTYAYFFEDVQGRAGAVNARTGEPLPATSCDDFQAAARATGRSIRAAGERLDEPDQWTLSSSFAPYFPLCRWRLEEPTFAYTSVRTGELVHRVTRRERWLAWVGAIPHWIYPAALRRHRAAWRGVVVGLAVAGTLVSLAGLLVGSWIGWRFRRRTGRWVPYVRPMPRWHHRLGLLFGLFACTWVLSGALSLDPLGMSNETRAVASLRERMQGGEKSQSLDRIAVEGAMRRCSHAMEVRELRFVRVLGTPYYRCAGDAEHVRLLRADEPGAPLLPALDRNTLARASRTIRPEASLVELRRLSQGDAYVYPNHFRPGRGRGVWRASYEDGARVYIDPTRGRIVAYFDASSKWHRWLYHGLHSWDLRWLLERETLRRALMIVALLGGLGASGTALILGLRRLRSPRA